MKMGFVLRCVKEMKMIKVLSQYTRCSKDSGSVLKMVCSLASIMYFVIYRTPCCIQYLVALAHAQYLVTSGATNPPAEN